MRHRCLRGAGDSCLAGGSPVRLNKTKGQRDPVTERQGVTGPHDAVPAMAECLTCLLASRHPSARPPPSEYPAQTGTPDCILGWQPDLASQRGSRTWQPRRILRTGSRTWLLALPRIPHSTRADPVPSPEWVRPAHAGRETPHHAETASHGRTRRGRQQMRRHNRSSSVTPKLRPGTDRQRQTAAQFREVAVRHARFLELSFPRPGDGLFHLVHHMRRLVIG